MEPTFITPDIRMADLERAIAKLSSLWRTTADKIKDAYKINYEFLRFEVALKPNTTQYEVNPVEGNDTLKVLERKLASGHAFVATAAGIILHKADFNNTAGTYSNEGTYPLFTSPDPAQFVGVPASGIPEYRQLLGLYNGKLSFRKDSEIIARLPLVNCLKTPLGNYNATAPIQLPEFGADLESLGVLQRIYPQILMDGSATNRVVLDIPTGDTSVIDGSVNAAGAAVNTSRNFVSIIMAGFYIENKPEGASSAVCKM